MGKVRILPSGEIVGEDDPRFNPTQNRTQQASTSAPSSSSGSQQPLQQRFGRIGGTPNQQQQPISLFEQANQKIAEFGVPPLTLGAYYFEPIWPVLAVIALYFFGIPALILIGIFYMIRRADTQRTPPSGDTRRAGGGGGGGGGRPLGRL